MEYVWEYEYCSCQVTTYLAHSQKEGPFMQDHAFRTMAGEEFNSNLKYSIVVLERKLELLSIMDNSAYHC